MADELKVDGARDSANMGVPEVISVLPLRDTLVFPYAMVPMAADGGGPPRIADLRPPPGEVEPEAQFHVVFSEAIDEGMLLASTGRSETVELARSEEHTSELQSHL